MLTLTPINLKTANAFVQQHHRHHKPTRGHKFSIGVSDNGALVGVAICGRPVARRLDDGYTLEVNRLCTDGTPNACSILYAAAYRAARAMGYNKVVTYILDTENGSSLKAAGYTCEGRAGGLEWNGAKAPKQADQYDGYTGTNFNRPAFQKMIVDLKQGNIKVIVVKDLSRLGRDYIGVGDYIEQIFPLMGVRFIAVNNSFDSMKLNNGTPGIEVAVSNLVNNMYSRDIAKKIRATLETNWKNGKATCTNVPFGYVWNKKGGRRWEIDPEAAVCVKKVFELALSGRNTTQIAYGMNELNLPTPGLY